MKNVADEYMECNGDYYVNHSILHAYCYFSLIVIDSCGHVPSKASHFLSSLQEPLGEGCFTNRLSFPHHR
jgi:hypothetical protein